MELFIKISSLLFGGVGFLGWFLQYRKSNADITIQIQSIYREMIKDTEKELTELRNDYKALKIDYKNLKFDYSELKKSYYELKNSN